MNIIYCENMIDFVDQIKQRIEKGYTFDYQISRHHLMNWVHIGQGYTCIETNEYISLILGQCFLNIKLFNISHEEFVRYSVPIWVKNHIQIIDKVLKMKAFL